MTTTTKYHFRDKDGKVIEINSDNISMRNSIIKFKNNFYVVNDTYQEILENGLSLYHHECHIK